MRKALLLLAALTIANAATAEERLTPSLAIDSVMPNVAAPHGGSPVSIRGRGFSAPVRLFFEIGAPAMIEAFVYELSSNEIRALTPAVFLGPDEQMRAAKVIVESRGIRVEARDPFIFENLVLQPKILTVSPNSGPKSGGTRVTIFGEGFQQPVQVLFGVAEARIYNVTRDQIVAEAPEARELGTVGVLVRNINSMTETTLDDAYRYLPSMEITNVTPNRGRVGTEITIDGVGFIAPVVVNIAGAPARVLSVTSTKIRARIEHYATCASVTGPVEVINVANGDTSTGGEFTLELEQPQIVAVSPRSVLSGKFVNVQLARPGDYEFQIGNSSARVVSVQGSIYRLFVPHTLPFRLEACELRGVQGLGPVESKFDLRVTDRATGCQANRPRALTVAPAAPVPCSLPPLVSVLPRTCSSRTVTFTNERGRSNLVVTAPPSVHPPSATIVGGKSMVFHLPETTQLERLRFETTDPRHPWLLVCASP